LPASTNQPSLVVTGNVHDNGAVASAQLIVNGTAVATLAPDSSGNVTAPAVTLVQGLNSILLAATDRAGNVGEAQAQVVLETTPPVLTLPGTITVTPTSASGAPVSYAASATDNVDGSDAVTCNPPSGSTFAPGATTVTCTASDRAGNKATGSFQVRVQYSWSGFLPPVNTDGSSIFKLGRTVPVKFQLTGASASITNAVATLSVAQISGTVTGTVVEAVSTSAATTGNTFRYDPTAQQYIFNMATNSLSTGTWQLSVNLGDGVSRTVDISLR
jgi:hypothetical protein